MSELHRPSIAVLATGEVGGGGSTLKEFVEATQKGIVDADVGLVICNLTDSGVFDKVADLNAEYGLDIETQYINQYTHPGGKQERGQTLEESAAICEIIAKGNFTLVALMGYMRIVAAEGDLMKEYGWLPEFDESDPFQLGVYRARMINTHPGILPATADTYGIHAQERVLELGLTETAQTLHAVAAEVDAGPIIAENRVPVLPGDDPQKLFDRVQRIEKAHLPIDIDTFLKNLRQVQAT